MGLSVVGDLVATREDGPDERRVGGHVLAGDKKRCARAVVREEGEDEGSVRGVRSVVDGQPHLALVGAKMPVHPDHALGAKHEHVIRDQGIGHSPQGEGRRGRGQTERDGRDFPGEIEADHNPHAAHDGGRRGVIGTTRSRA